MIKPAGQQIVAKTWGYEEWIVNFDKYCGKILHLNKNHFCSFHAHKLKEETFHVLYGKVGLVYCSEPRVSNGEIDFTDYGNDIDDLSFPKWITMHPGMSFHIPIGLYHRFYGLENSKILEISTQHFESDSYRALPSGEFDDLYGIRDYTK